MSTSDEWNPLGQGENEIHGENDALEENVIQRKNTISDENVISEENGVREDGNIQEERNTQQSVFPGTERPQGVFSGRSQEETANFADQSQNPYGNPGYVGQSQNPYGNPGYVSQSQDPYGNPGYASQSQNPYGNPGYAGQNQNPYGNPGYAGQNQNPYGNPGYASQSQNPYGNPGYADQNQNPYGNPGYAGQNQNPYGNPGYAGQSRNPYANSYHAGEQGINGYPGMPQYGDNRYSPYDRPQKKGTAGVIILVTVLVVLFLVAVGALICKAVKLEIEKEKRTAGFYGNQEYEQHDPYSMKPEEDFSADDEYGWDEPYDYDDYDYYDDLYGDYDSDAESPYYELHDAIEEDLSYRVVFKTYEYDTEDENVLIAADYPVIEGKDVPNIEKLNEVILKEAERYAVQYEEKYLEKQDEEFSSFSAYSYGYVTYMDEEKLSIVFQEAMIGEAQMLTEYIAELHCINIDMEKGIVLENTQMLSIDDDFSVEFRQKSDTQNGEIGDLTYMTDQQITEYFLSDGVIVFYTPMGMEIGFNYENGWVTATYEEYEQYLKVF